MTERFHIPKVPACMAIGAVVLTGAGYGGHEVYQAWPRYAEVTLEQGSTANDAAMTLPNVITANAHNELPEKIDDLEQEVELEDPSLLMMQEVSEDAVDDLKVAFPAYDIAYARGDIKVKFGRGGIGNLIMSKTKLTNVKAYKLDQPGFVEDRVVLSADTDIVVEGIKRTVQVVTYHIDRHEGYRQQQFGALVDHVKQISKDKESSIVCGDNNTRPLEARRRFSKGENSFISILPSEKTYIGSKFGSIVDSCAFKNQGKVGFSKAVIAKKFRTDHRPVRYVLEELVDID
jgi:exonuclease III